MDRYKQVPTDKLSMHHLKIPARICGLAFPVILRSPIFKYPKAALQTAAVQTKVQGHRGRRRLSIPSIHQSPFRPRIPLGVLPRPVVRHWVNSVGPVLLALAAQQLLPACMQGGLYVGQHPLRIPDQRPAAPLVHPARTSTCTPVPQQAFRSGLRGRDNCCCSLNSFQHSAGSARPTWRHAKTVIGLIRDSIVCGHMKRL